MRTTSNLLVLLAFAAMLAATPAARASGILAPRDQTLPPLRVTGHAVDVSIHDQVALTKVTQTFHNDTGQRLEATYVFPLPEQGELTDFQMTFNGKMVQGRVLPAKEARRIYESIVRQSRDPGLIEFIGRRLLQMRVFPIEPGSDTTIQVRYQQICRPISGMHGYHYPLRTGQTSGKVFGTLRFTVDLETSAALKSIWSPSHAVEIVRRGENEARVGYEASSGSLEDDFTLLYDTEGSDVGLSVIGYRPGDNEAGHFVLMLTPKQLWPDREYQPQDVVFVLDTSGSMAGDKIEQARRALGYCVDQLEERDRFSVVRFSTGFDLLFDEPRPATREARKQAREWIEQFRAAGGTNIADAMRAVMGLQPAEDGQRPFVVVFLTDGQGNREPDEIMSLLAEGRTDDVRPLRIFPFGVGHDVNTVLLDRLATTYQGRPTYVQPGENLELVLGDFFSVVSQPVLTSLKLSLPDIGATERFPASLGDLYHGQQIVVAGKFDRPATGRVKLTAVRNGTPVEFAWPEAAFVHTEQAGYVPAVWAGRKIAYLVDQIRAHGESDELIAEVLQLSQRYGIQTPYSSWLVDPERPQLAGRPGGGGGFGGGGTGGGFRGRSAPAPGVQQQIVDSYSIGQASAEPTMLGAELLVLGEMEEGLQSDSGKAATVLARRNAGLREMTSVGGDRLDSRLLLRQQIEGQWYNRLGAFLVDERVDEQTGITAIKFGSAAHFELIGTRSDLRKVLARSRYVIVIAAEGQAVLVSDDGADTFTPEQRRTLNLPAVADEKE